MKALALAWLGLVAAVASLGAGVYLVAGLGVALIVLGVLLGAFCLLCIDIERGDRP